MSLGSLTFKLGGDLEIRRLGYGAMRITGDGIWGEPSDPEQAKAVLRRAAELGVNFIDTADSYGPDVSERLIGEALHPYASDMVIATKGGLLRGGPNIWYSNGRPEHLRISLEKSLRQLKLDRIDLYQLHRIDAQVPLEESLGALSDLRNEGKIRHIGLSEVNNEQLAQAQKVVPIVSVQNRYSIGDHEWESMVDACEAQQIAFIPWFPLAAGKLTAPGGTLDQIAKKYEATVGQIALAWLLKRSPVILPIPGTSKIKHLEENLGAEKIALSDEDFQTLRELQA